MLVYTVQENVLDCLCSAGEHTGVVLCHVQVVHVAPVNVDVSLSRTSVID